MSGQSALLGIVKATLILSAGAAGGIGVYHKVSGESRATPGGSTASPRADGPELVRALGSIQPKDGVIEVALPAGFLPGEFAEGIVPDALVKKGAIIAYLQGYEARLRELDVIDAEIAEAELAIQAEEENQKLAVAEIDRERDQARRLGAMEATSLDLKIKALIDKHALCRLQLKDMDGLQGKDIVPRQQIDQLTAQEKISLEELEYARAEARRVAASVELNTSDARVDQQKAKAGLASRRAKGQIAIEALRSKRKLAVAMRDQTRVVSPIDGVVLEICTKAGESGAGKPLVKLGDTSRMYVLAEVYEDDRRLVEPGQKVEVRSRGLPIQGGGPILGTVERVQSIIGAHRMSPLDPSSRDNARVFHAWIALQPLANPLEQAKLGKSIQIPVNVTIFVAEKPPGA